MYKCNLYHKPIALHHTSMVDRDGQMGGPAWARWSPACQAQLENRVGPSKPAGSISCPSLARSGRKWVRPARLARKKRAKRVGKHVLVQKSGLNGLRGKRVVSGLPTVPSLLSEPGPDPYRTGSCQARTMPK
jgi:hypothetical protein